MKSRSMRLWLWLTTSSWLFAAHAAPDSRLGSNVEQQLAPEVPVTLWTRDAERLTTREGDSIKLAVSVYEAAVTRKLDGIVPPIRFGSGVSEVPRQSIETLKRLLVDLKDHANLRVHLVGHADPRPLAGELAARYGDNEGLSRERAGEVAEVLQRMLQLPPGTISYEWAGASRPLADNASAAGRAVNRRVEIELWYDAVEEATRAAPVVIPARIEQEKVCRATTVCKLSYRFGFERRTRVKNLVLPLHYQDAALEPNTLFLEQIEQALAGMSNKSNLVLRFVGHTDDRRLNERNDVSTVTTRVCPKRARGRSRCVLPNGLALRATRWKATGTVVPGRWRVTTRRSVARTTAGSRSSSGTTTTCKRCPMACNAVRGTLRTNA